MRASREHSRPSTIRARPRDTPATRLGKTALDVAREIARAASARLPGRELDLAPVVRTALAVHGTGRFNVVIDALDEAASLAQARLIVGQTESWKK